jgi:hypothetical protein
MPIVLNGSTGETFPTWTTATRPATPNAGQTGFNTTLGVLETYNGVLWSPDSPIILNGKTLTASYTIPSNYGAHSVGPITLANGVSLTVSANSKYVVL